MYDEKSQFVLFLKNNKKKNFFKINTIPKNITGKVHAKQDKFEIISHNIVIPITLVF